MCITLAGIGYLGLSTTLLLAQHNKVTAVDINPPKVEKTKTANRPSKTITLKSMHKRSLQTGLMCDP